MSQVAQNYPSTALELFSTFGACRLTLNQSLRIACVENIDSNVLETTVWCVETVIILSIDSTQIRCYGLAALTVAVVSLERTTKNARIFLSEAADSIGRTTRVITDSSSIRPNVLLPAHALITLDHVKTFLVLAED